MTSDGYNGWTNYETWAVALWLDNDEASQEWARILVATHGNKAADVLQQAITNTSPLDEASVYTDLLTHALGRVNWDEVARYYREQIAEEIPF